MRDARTDAVPSPDALITTLPAADGDAVFDMCVAVLVGLGLFDGDAEDELAL